MRRRRANPEGAIQKAVFAHLKARAAPGVFAFHVPNGGKRSPIEAAIMKGQGVRAGVPDLCLIHEGKAYFLELKADKGRLSEAQSQVMGEIERAGARWGMAIGLDAALLLLEGWNLLRGRAA